MIPTAYIAPGSDMVDSVNYDCVQGVGFDECFTPVAGETCPPVSISCLGTSTVATIHSNVLLLSVRVSVCYCSPADSNF